VSRRLCPSSCISDSASLSIWSSVPRYFIGSCALFVSQRLPIFVIWNNNVVLGIILFPYRMELLLGRRDCRLVGDKGCAGGGHAVSPTSNRLLTKFHRAEHMKRHAVEPLSESVFFLCYAATWNRFSEPKSGISPVQNSI
jgi:hypothetical protein